MTIIYTDGALKRICFVIEGQPPFILDGTYQTQNIAEYQAVISALMEAKQQGLTDLIVRSDSQLTMRQLNGEYSIKVVYLASRAREVWELARKFNSVKFEWIPREENKAGIQLEKFKT